MFHQLVYPIRRNIFWRMLFVVEERSAASSTPNQIVSGVVANYACVCIMDMQDAIFCSLLLVFLGKFA